MLSLIRFILLVTDDSIRDANSKKSEINEKFSNEHAMTEQISNIYVIYYRSRND